MVYHKKRHKPRHKSNIFKDTIKENYFLLIVLIGLTFVVSIQGCQPSEPTLRIGGPTCCEILNLDGTAESCISNINEIECSESVTEGGYNYYSNSCKDVQSCIDTVKLSSVADLKENTLIFAHSQDLSKLYKYDIDKGSLELIYDFSSNIYMIYFINDNEVSAYTYSVAEGHKSYIVDIKQKSIIKVYTLTSDLMDSRIYKINDNYYQYKLNKPNSFEFFLTKINLDTNKKVNVTYKFLLSYSVDGILYDDYNVVLFYRGSSDMGKYRHEISSINVNMDEEIILFSETRTSSTDIVYKVENSKADNNLLIADIYSKDPKYEPLRYHTRVFDLVNNEQYSLDKQYRALSNEMAIYNYERFTVKNNIFDTRFILPNPLAKKSIPYMGKLMNNDYIINDTGIHYYYTGQCKDSDAGLIYTKIGQTKGYDIDNTFIEVEDRCINQNTVLEYFCDSTGYVHDQQYICQGKCSYGGCYKECDTHRDCPREKSCINWVCVETSCGNNICEEGEDYNNCVRDCTVNADLTVRTLKKRYNIGEQVLLTDPPQIQDSQNSLEENKVTGNVIEKIIELEKIQLNKQDTQQEITQTLETKLNYKGYIVKYKEKPLAQKKYELEEEISENERYLEEASVVKKYTIGLIKQIDLSYDKFRFNSRINNQKEKIGKEHIENKNKIEAKLNKNIDDIKLSEFSDVFNGVALDIGDEEFSKLEEIEDIKNIYPNYRVEATLMDSVPSINADDVWLLDEDGNDCSVSGKQCLTGKNVTIAVIDTGVDYTHEDLGGCLGNDFSSSGGGGGSGGGSESTFLCASFTQLFDDEIKNDVVKLTEKIIFVSEGKELCTEEVSKFNSELKSLLALRKDLLYDTIKNNPAKALAVAELPNSLISTLSTSEREQLVEKREEFTGKLNVFHGDDFVNKKFEYFYILDSIEGNYNLFFSGEKPVMDSGALIKFNGLSLRDRMVSSLENNEFTILSVPPGSPASENFGNQKTLVIVANIGDRAAPTTVENARNLLFNSSGVGDYYIKNSYNQSYLEGDVFGVYNLTNESCNMLEVQYDSLSASKSDLEQLGKSFSDYDRLILAVPCTSCFFCGGGFGTIGKVDFSSPDGQMLRMSTSWDSYFSFGIVGHELGHNLGTMHANLYRCKNSSGYTSYSYDCESAEYTDLYDIMGFTAWTGHMNAAHNKEVGWLNDSNIITTTNGTYEIKPIEIKVNPGEIQLIKIPFKNYDGFYPDKNNTFYTLEFRQPLYYDNVTTGFGKNGFSTVTLRIAQFNDAGEFTGRQTNLININPDSNLGREGFNIGQSFVDRINGYNITLLSMNSSEARVSINEIPREYLNYANPVAYYDFENMDEDLVEDKSGEIYIKYMVNDKSGYTFGRYAYGVTPRAGGLLFGNEYISYMELGGFSSSQIKNNNQFTISLWLNLKTQDYYYEKMIYSIGNYGTLTTIERNNVTLNARFNVENLPYPIAASVQSNELLSFGTWHHVAGVYNGGELSLYIDGVKKGSLNSVEYYYDGSYYTSPINNLNIDYAINSFIGDYRGGSVNGIIDEVKIYARGLNEKEVFELYDGFTPTPDGDSSSCKVIGGYDFVNNDNDPMDDNGHGTHVATTAAGNGVLKGVAPDAKIVGYKVLDEWGSGYWDDILNAIEISIDPNQDGDFSDHHDIISMSLGGPGNPDDAISQAVDTAVDNGVIAIIAAGNSGPDEETIESPGTARKAITVGAMNKYRDMVDFSSRGPVIWDDINEEYIISKPDIVAPGVNICAAQWSDAWSSSECIDTEHTAISGTSMATPHVSGLVALLKQKNPDWSPDEIKTTLKNTAVDLGFSINTQGFGKVDSLNLINSQKLPVAIISTSSLNKENGLINIYGTANSDNFKEYNLYYKDKNDNSWKLICVSSVPVINSGLCSTSDYSILSDLSDGVYEIKLVVENNDGVISEDFGLYRGLPESKSIIENFDKNDLEGYLIMEVQKYNDINGIWESKQLIAARKVTIPANSYLVLDTIWGENPYTTTETGRFRVYAELRSMNQDVAGGIILSDNYEFEVD